MIPLLMLSGLSFAADPAFEHYCNPRFAFCVDVPSGMKALSPPTNGDGQSWQGPGQSQVAVWGSWNAADQIIEQLCPEKSEFDSVALWKVAKDWCVASGWQKGKIVYRRMQLSEGRVVGVNLTYPASQRGFFDGKLGRVVKSIQLMPMNYGVGK
jgi:hypothetical protein